MRFRQLRADEIEARISTVKKDGSGLGVLLYKNARCDMKILDECVGEMNWQRDHKDLKGRMYAGIGIYNEERNEWVWKWDCGTESNTEEEKGEASDSFKRAGFNWGIGRELYTAPFIWFRKGEFEDKYDKFKVDEIVYENDKILSVTITNTTSKKTKTFSNKTAKEVIAENKEKNDNADKKISAGEWKVLEGLLTQANYGETMIEKYKEWAGVDDLKNISKGKFDALCSKIKGEIKAKNGNERKAS